MAQTTQNAQQPLLRAGQMMGNAGQFVVDSQGAAQVAIAAGLFTSRGTAADQRKLPTSSGEVTASGMGFAVLDTAHGSGSLVASSPTASTEYQIGDEVPVCRRGPGVVGIAGIDLAADDPIFVGYGSAVRGQVLKAAGSGNTAAAQVPGKVLKAATSGNPVLLDVNFP